MGKAKRRNFNKTVDNIGMVLKRDEVISEIISDIKFHKITEQTMKNISLFGISIEEIFEAGANYEDLSAIKHLFL